MSKSHDSNCLSANRFGDGFDCICEPDWKSMYNMLVKELQQEKDRRVEHVQKNQELNEMVQGLTKRLGTLEIKLRRFVTDWRAEGEYTSGCAPMCACANELEKVLEKL